MAKAKREREDLEAKRRGENAIEAAREARAARKFALGKGAAKEPEAEAAGAWAWWFWAVGLVLVLPQCDDTLDTLPIIPSSVRHPRWT